MCFELIFSLFNTTRIGPEAALSRAKAFENAEKAEEIEK